MREKRRHISSGLGGQAASLEGLEHHQLAFDVGFYSLGGNQDTGPHWPSSWVGLECVSVYPMASARDQREGQTRISRREEP